VPFTLVHAGKYETEDKLKTDTTKTKHLPRSQKLNTTQKRQTMQNTAEQNYDTQPGNEVGLFYNAPEHTRVLCAKIVSFTFN